MRTYTTIPSQSYDVGLAGLAIPAHQILPFLHIPLASPLFFFTFLTICRVPNELRGDHSPRKAPSPPAKLFVSFPRSRPWCAPTYEKPGVHDSDNPIVNLAVPAGSR